MHELSLAENMLNTALQAGGCEGKKLRALNVRCGALSGVSIQSLEFCLQLVCEERGLEDVAVNITSVPAGLKCQCGHSFDAGTLFCECPECGSTGHEVVGGEEVFLESIEVEDEQDQA